MSELKDIPYGFDNGIVAKTKEVLSGDIRVSGTRIGLDLLIACELDGMSREEISQDYNIPLDKLDAVYNWILENNDVLDLWGINNS